MTQLAEKIVREHLVRKTRKQKKAFRAMLIRELAALGIEAHEETSSSATNIVVGDPERAELVFGAHYDTQPRMPIPNLITPRNWLWFIAWQLVLVAAIYALGFVVGFATMKLTHNIDLFSLASAGTCVAVCLLMMCGPANPHTYNDNTSGVVSLVELLGALDEGTRARVAFVFFDNEELGMLGSSAFRARHKEHMKTTPLVNMDCVGDGDTLMLVASSALRKDERLYESLRRAFSLRGPVLHVPAATTIYPSDQMGYSKSLAIAALKHGKALGYYMDRIHTVRDTVLSEENVRRVSEGLADMTRDYLG